MGQQEIYDFLRFWRLGKDEPDRWFSAREIYLCLDKVHSLNSIFESTKKLSRGGFDSFIERRSFDNVTKFRCRKSLI